MDAMPPPLPARARGRAPRKRWPWWKVLLLVLGIPIGLLLLLISCGTFFDLTAKDLPVRPRDREALLTAEAFLPYLSEDFDQEQGTETIGKRRYIDGSHELTYEYEYASDVESLYVYCMVSAENSIRDAKTTYSVTVAGGDIGLAIEDAKATRRDDLLRWGDASEFSVLLTEDGAPFGNRLVARRGRIVVELAFSGIYWDQREGLTELLEPVLERVGRYTP